MTSSPELDVRSADAASAAGGTAQDRVTAGTSAVRTDRRSTLLLLWGAAATLGTLGATIGFAASPGLNWGLWTAAAALAFVLLLRHARGVVPLPVAVPLVLATLLAAGVSVTFDPRYMLLIFVGVAACLAIATVLANGLDVRALGAIRLVFAPPVALALAAREALQRVIRTAGLARDTRFTGVVRGTLLALPVVAVLALLLSAADPVLGAARDGLLRLFGDSLLVPRLVFFTALTGLSLGALGIVVRGGPRAAPAAAVLPARSAGVGDTERTIVLGATAALFALFLLLQLSYFFGAVPAVAGSGMTYAEYARRGFAELSVAATVATLLVVGLDWFAAEGASTRVRVLEYVLVALVQLLLGSAWHRLSLYEQAYGYTEARLTAQAYMVLISLVLVVLDVEIARRVDVRRLARRTALLTTTVFLGLVWWNHDAWIVQRNVTRYERTGRLDVRYLTDGLRLNAVPAVRDALPRLSSADREIALACLRSNYAGAPVLRARRWFEYNHALVRAQAALAELGISARERASEADRSTCRPPVGAAAD